MDLSYHCVLISSPYDIWDFMICSPISWHGLARVGAARGQVLHLLWPHHSQRAGDGCSAEQRRANNLDPAHGLVQSLQLQV
jgi:hypothetical protein